MRPRSYCSTVKLYQVTLPVVVACKEGYYYCMAMLSNVPLFFHAIPSTPIALLVFAPQAHL